MHSCQNKSCKAYNLEIPSALVLEGNFKCYLCSTPLLSESSSVKDLTYRINRDYPSLLARPYSAMISRTDPEAALKRLLDVFTGLLKLLATLMESEYLHSKKLDPELTEIILKDLKTPTLGKWMYFLHTALNLGKLEEVVFKEYREYFLKYYNDLSEILSYRNEFYHSFQGSEEKLKEDYRKYKVLLDKLLSALPLTAGLYVKGKSSTVYEMKGLYPNVIQSTTLKFEDSEALFWDGKDKILSVFPLHATEEGEESNSFMYVASTDKRIIYEGLHGETLDTVRTQNRYKELLKRKTPQRKVLRDDKDKELISRMQEETRKTLKELQEVGKFISEKYVHRIYPEREMDRFIESSMTGLLVLAHSGGGKSSLLAYYAEKLLLEKIPVLFLQGKLLNDEFVEAQFQGLLDIDFDLSDALGTYEFLNEKSFRGIIIIDAVNEAQNPERVLQGLLKFAEEIKESECKILLSLRSDFWLGIDSINKEEYPLDFFMTPLGENLEPEKEPRLVLNPLTGEEKNSLYKRMGGKKESLLLIENENRPLWDYMQSPLHLSFYCAIEKNFTSPEILSPDSVQREYFQNIVVQNKQNIADCLRALGFFLLEKDVSKISLEEAWEMETTKRYLKDRKPDSPFTLLTKADILREFRSGGETFILFTYDIYLEESVGLALLSKPYRGSGRQLVKLNPEMIILQSSIASIVARSTLDGDFSEILSFLDACYSTQQKREEIHEFMIHKIAENSLYSLKDLSNVILDRSKDADWEVLYEIAKILVEFLQYEEAMNLYPSIISKVENLRNEETLGNLFDSYGRILYTLGNYDMALMYLEKSLKIDLSISGENHPDVARSYNNIGSVYDSQGEYEKALEYQEKSLKIRLSIHGENHPGVASSYINIGSVYHSQGEYEKALEYYVKSLKINLSILGENHPDVATSYNNIGNVYHSQGEYEKALEYQEKSLKIDLSIRGENHPDVATSYINIGNVYQSQGMYEKALEYQEKSLKINLPILGENHPDLATSYIHIGNIYHSQGDYEKTLEYYEKSLKIYLSILGENHPDMATSYNNIGNVYQSQGEYEKALEYYEKSLKISLSILGENHPSVATSYNNIGGVCNFQGEYEKALEYYEKSLKIRLSILGENHPDVASSYNNIGIVYRSQGEYEKALEYYKKSLKIRLSILGENHPDVAINYNNIGGVYKSQGEYEKALEYYEKSLKIRLSIFGENHPSVASSYISIGSVYDSQGEYEKSLKIYLSILGENHPSVASCYINIGSVYRSQGEYENALKYYEESLKIYLSILGENHPEVASSYNNIGIVYDSQGEYEKALEYYEKSLKIRFSILGENHPSVKTTQSNLTTILEQIDSPEIHLNTHRFIQELYPENHSYLAEIYITTGDCFQESDSDFALGIYQKANSIYETLEEEYEVVSITLKIGDVYENLDELDSALLAYQKAISIYEALGEESNIASTTLKIGDVYEGLDELDSALLAYQKARELYVSLYGEDDSDVANCYKKLGRVYTKQETYPEALEVLEKSLEIYFFIYGKGDSDVAEVCNIIADVYNKMGDTEKAEEYRNRALEEADEDDEMEDEGDS